MTLSADEVEGAGLAETSSESKSSPRRSTSPPALGAGTGGGAACTPSAPADIMSEVIVASESIISVSSADRGLSVGTARVRPLTKVAGGLWYMAARVERCEMSSSRTLGSSANVSSEMFGFSASTTCFAASGSVESSRQ